MEEKGDEREIGGLKHAVGGRKGRLGKRKRGKERVRGGSVRGKRRDETADRQPASNF